MSVRPPVLFGPPGAPGRSAPTTDSGGALPYTAIGRGSPELVRGAECGSGAGVSVKGTGVSTATTLEKFGYLSHNGKNHFGGKSA
jgi:hypothetical protein